MKAKLQEAMKTALKAREKVQLETIRGLLSALQYEEMQKDVEELPESEAIAVLQREIKKRVEEREYAEKASRTDLIEKLNLEVQCLEGFLPAQLSAEEIEVLVRGLKDKSPQLNLGQAMKALQESHAGRYNGKLASEVIRKVIG